MAASGVAREKLCITGIPVDPLFAKPVDRNAVRKHLGLDPIAPIVLVAAGGEGVGPIEQLVRGLLELRRPWQIVAIDRKSTRLNSSHPINSYSLFFFKKKKKKKRKE